MILTIQSRSVPQAFVRVEAVAGLLSVQVEQVNAWCASGRLGGELHHNHWWVKEADLRRFVEACTWRLDAVPPVPRSR